jgi:cell division protein FtsB
MLRRTGRVARRLIWPLVLVVVIAVIVTLGAYPVRTYLDKKQQVAAAETQLSDLTADNDRAQAHIDALHTDGAVEQIARENGLVKPGDEVYHVLPPPEDPVQIPDVWPFDRLHKHLG